ncbi:MAG TPA: lysine-sensitive aspartokinase 3 [Pyrinomonadaceae bacterium]|nr:lysine-sensitive aspartokinase 3 [Pyrinomonadaceae bacterium]
MSIVMKFGGTSVADAPAFENVARVVGAQRDASPVVVVSAMSGVTDRLLAAATIASERNAHEAISSLEDLFDRHKREAKQLLAASEADAFSGRVNDAATHVAELLRKIEHNPSEFKPLQDGVVSTGETLSSTLLAEVLKHLGITARQVDARRCIITDEEYTSASPLMDHTFSATQEELRPLLENKIVPVLGGFIASTTTGATTTLGRGGSDYTAALIGAALNADEIQIWTDVTGVLTADPRVVPEAQTVERLSYSEAAELAYFGAKVLHPKTIQPAIESYIPVRICNSRAPQERGTLVGPQTETSPRTLKAIAHKTGVTTVQITSARMLGAYGFLRALFEVFERHRTVVDVVTTSEVSVSLSLDDDSTLPEIVEELRKLGNVSVEKGFAIICVVGEGLQGQPGIAAKVFSTISDINVTLISQGASRINFTFAIEEGKVKEAVRRLHEAFFSAKEGHG